MRTMRSSLVAATVLAASLFANAASAETFTGNGGTGFGGRLGGGSLTVTPSGTNVTFSFTPSGSFTGNIVAIYLDTGAGGYTSTSSLTDTSSDVKTAISGLSSNGRTLLTFPATFDADVALTIKPDFFEAQNISNPATFSFISGGGQTAGAGPFTQTFSLSSLGITGTSFDVVATLISGSAYRSNETIGTSVTVPGSVGDTPNAGFTGTQVISTFGTVLVPEPTTLGALAGVGLVALRRRK